MTDEEYFALDHENRRLREANAEMQREIERQRAVIETWHDEYRVLERAVIKVAAIKMREIEGDRA